jgi:GTPase SAR1 family protein
MEKKDLIEEKIKAKVKEAKELPPADIKLILLGDSAVGKSK